MVYCVHSHPVRHRQDHVGSPKAGVGVLPTDASQGQMKLTLDEGQEETGEGTDRNLGSEVTEELEAHRW